MQMNDREGEMETTCKSRELSADYKTLEMSKRHSIWRKTQSRG